MSAVHLTILCGKKWSGKTKWCLENSNSQNIRLSLEDKDGGNVYGTSLNALIRTAVEHLQAGRNVMIDDQNFSPDARRDIITAVRKEIYSATVVSTCIYFTLSHSQDEKMFTWAKAWSAAASSHAATTPHPPREEHVIPPTCAEPFNIIRHVSSPLFWNRSCPPRRSALILEYGCWGSYPGILSVLALYWNQCLVQSRDTVIVILPMDRAVPFQQTVDGVKQLCLQYPSYVVGYETKGRLDPLHCGTIAYLQYLLEVSLDDTTIIRTSSRSKIMNFVTTVGLRYIPLESLQSACVDEKTNVIELFAKLSNDDDMICRPAFLTKVQLSSPTGSAPSKLPEESVLSCWGYICVRVDSAVDTVLSTFKPEVIARGSEYIHQSMILTNSFVVEVTGTNLHGSLRCYSSGQESIYDVVIDMNLRTQEITSSQCGCGAVVGTSSTGGGMVKRCRHVAALVLICLKKEQAPTTTEHRLMVAGQTVKPMKPSDAQTEAAQIPAPKPEKQIQILYEIPSGSEAISTVRGLPAHLLQTKNSKGQVAKASTTTFKRTRGHDPNAPKKPLSAYLYFCEAQRHRAKADHPSASMTDLSKILGTMWKELSEESRQCYVDMAMADRQRYDLEMETYVPQNVEEEDNLPQEAPRNVPQKSSAKIKKEKEEEPIPEDSIDFVQNFKERNDEWEYDAKQGRWVNEWDDTPAPPPLSSIARREVSSSVATSLASGAIPKAKRLKRQPKLATLAPQMSVGTTFNDD
eukprot:PhF_6_TR30534/c0_g1_i1/m.44787